MDYNLVYNPHDIICREGDPSSDLYFLKEGRLLICTVQGTQVKAIARIEPGEFIGELSFFDGNPRATHIIALERSIVIQLPKEDIMEHLPFWFIEVGKNLTKKIRLLDSIVHSSNFRKVGTEDQKPLTIEEQRQILSALNK
ncbi:MAG: cyclic nucleotide-binding domain-containing protein [Bacteriovoracia bacterium]